MMTDIMLDRTEAIARRIRRAADRSGRRTEDIRLIAVSKTHPAALIRRAMASGLRAFGENRVQEAVGKIEEIGRNACEWHLIGHLQKNKVRKAVLSFDVIHTIDSASLAERVQRICGEEGIKRLSVLLQVNLSGEQSKSGAAREEIGGVVRAMADCENLSFGGLMTIPPFLEDPELVRPYFRELRELRDELMERGEFDNDIGHLSMGMSHDFEAAIEEGATMVRVGTAIFGARE